MLANFYVHILLEVININEVEEMLYKSAMTGICYDSLEHSDVNIYTKYWKILSQDNLCLLMGLLFKEEIIYWSLLIL
jgi:hypothetical protein